MKKLLLMLVALLYIFVIPVYASEEDILKTTIEEDIKEDVKEDLKEDIKEDVKGTRAVVTDPQYALSMMLFVRSYNDNSVTQAFNIGLSNIPIGTEYYIITKGATIYDYRIPIGYFIRGQENLTSDYSISIEYNNVEYENKCKIYRLYDVDNGSNDYEIYFKGQEPTPEPTPTPEPEEPEEPEVDPETISGNEILREILRTNREINENVQGIYKLLSNNSVSDCVLSDNSVSDNIIYKRLEDYSTSESLSLIGLVLAFGALIIYLIHKTVFKIRR